MKNTKKAGAALRILSGVALGTVICAPVVGSLVSCGKTVEINSIAVKSNPTKTNYKKGDALDLTGLVVEVVKSDGKTEAIDKSKYSTSIAEGTKLDNLGSIAIEISYNVSGKTLKTSFNVIVRNEITEIEIAENPKLQYFKGEKFDSTGIKINAYYDNYYESVELDRSEFYLDVEDGKSLDFAGEIVVKAYLKQNNKVFTSFNINVYDKINIDSIEVTNNPDKTEYLTGDKFDSTGLEITGKVGDDSFILDKHNYNLSIKDGDVLSTAGTQNVTVTYLNDTVTITTSFSIEVEAKVAVTSVKFGTDSYKIKDTMATSFADNVSVLPNKGTDKSLIWSSSNEEVVTVNQNGTLFPVSIGTATITAKSASNPDISGSCTITVFKGVESISFDESIYIIPENATKEIEVNIQPKDANVTVSWELVSESYKDNVTLTPNGKKCSITRKKWWGGTEMIKVTATMENGDTISTFCNLRSESK